MATLKNLESGTIDLEVISGVMFLQFNCNCEDALPYCQAMCCKMRYIYNAKISEDEANSFKNIVVKNKDGEQVRVLQWKPDFTCIYLEENKCSIHSAKPYSCRSEHCSPRGNPNDESIVKRDKGWMLLPSGAK